MINSYQDILWSRPTRRTGRILLVGGHRDGFAELQKAFVGFDVAGAAECHLALPDKLHKLVGNLEGISLVPSNPSGSIARDALSELVQLADESDAVCLGPDLSNNSETTLAMQRLIAETRASVIIPPQSTEQLKSELTAWGKRSNLLVWLDQKQLLALAAKLAVNVDLPLAITPDVIKLVTQKVSEQYSPTIIVAAKDTISYATSGEVGQIPITLDTSDYGALTGLTGLFWIQNASSKFQALQAALHVAQQATMHQSLQVGIKQELAKL